VVVLDGELLGKPRDAAEAIAVLSRLAGREHLVATGLALYEPGADGDGDGREAVTVELTRVEMAPMSRPEVEWYVATGEPLDKAGSYAIQGHGALFVEAVDGNYTNVVGLPLPATYRLFAELGYDLRLWATQSI
jgi:septum formation protein